jgi:hypothetical protein
MNNQLNDQDRAQLAALTQIPGFGIFKVLCEAEIFSLQRHMMEADPVNREEVLTRHLRAQAASVFYENVLQRMRIESEQLTGKQANREVGPDPTASLYDE